MMLRMRFYLLFLSLVFTQNLAFAKTVDVILNDEISPLGILEEVLVAAGYNINIYDAKVDRLDDLLRKKSDLLLILGGRQNAKNIAEHPYLETEYDIIRSRISNSQPVLGICLGAQIMAIALGGNTDTLNEPERGWTQIHPILVQESSPIQDLFTTDALLYSSHKDAITELPSNATLLATSDRAIQAFAVGKHSLALQFHPEATPDILRSWPSFQFHQDPEAAHFENCSIFSQTAPRVMQFFNDWLLTIEEQAS